MKAITADQLIRFAKTLEGKELYTLTQRKPFTVKVVRDTIIYTPKSTGLPRPHPIKYSTLVCNEFSKTNSYHPSDYTDITRHASYTLALISLYFETARR